MNERSARRRGLYLHITQQISMSQAGFEPAIPAGERRQTYALDRSTTEISSLQPV
jgi:hypothetical protein